MIKGVYGLITANAVFEKFTLGGKRLFATENCPDPAKSRSHFRIQDIAQLVATYLDCNRYSSTPRQRAYSLEIVIRT